MVYCVCIYSIRTYTVCECDVWVVHVSTYASAWCMLCDVCLQSVSVRGVWCVSVWGVSVGCVCVGTHPVCVCFDCFRVQTLEKERDKAEDRLQVEQSNRDSLAKLRKRNEELESELKVICDTQVSCGTILSQSTVLQPHPTMEQCM